MNYEQIERAQIAFCSYCKENECGDCVECYVPAFAKSLQVTAELQKMKDLGGVADESE